MSFSLMLFNRVAPAKGFTFSSPTFFATSKYPVSATATSLPGTGAAFFIRMRMRMGIRFPLAGCISVASQPAAENILLVYSFSCSTPLSSRNFFTPPPPPRAEDLPVPGAPTSSAVGSKISVARSALPLLFPAFALPLLRRNGEPVLSASRKITRSAFMSFCADLRSTLDIFFFSGDGDAAVDFFSSVFSGGLLLFSCFTSAFAAVLSSLAAFRTLVRLREDFLSPAAALGSAASPSAASASSVTVARTSTSGSSAGFAVATPVEASAADAGATSAADTSATLPDGAAPSTAVSDAGGATPAAFIPFQESLPGAMNSQMCFAWGSVDGSTKAHSVWFTLLMVHRLWRAACNSARANAPSSCSSSTSCLSNVSLVAISAQWPKKTPRCSPSQLVMEMVREFFSASASSAAWGTTTNPQFFSS
mmetsp:Transcript_8064/g.19489  ORF Transcript_8064/g.19489 Transcript_8064/m.19489 type:complete len:421 (-) Transcript_8064:356-1618(-)